MDSRPLSFVYVLGGLLSLQALSGVIGGYGLTADPTGRAIGLEPEWLVGSPFPDYRVPGVILLVILGIAPAAAAVGVFRGRAWSWWGALLVGVSLLIWIGVEILVVGYIAAPPLQLAYGVLALAILGTALLPSVRGALARRRDIRPTSPRRST